MGTVLQERSLQSVTDRSLSDLYSWALMSIFSLQRLSEAYSGVFCKADVDECGEPVAEVASLPTFVVYKKAGGGWYIADRVGLTMSFALLQQWQCYRLGSLRKRRVVRGWCTI